MPDYEFVPLTPRRLQRFTGSAPAERPPIDEDAPNAEGGDAAAVSDSEALEEDVVHAVADPRLTFAGADSDASRIRAVAIVLAAAACARALRYAVDRNPRLLARFVDDALQAAGSPRNAVVRIAPDAPVGEHAIAFDFVVDPALRVGDVIVDCVDGTLGATLEERAERLVRSVAS